MTEPQATPSVGREALSRMLRHKWITGISGLVLVAALGNTGGARDHRTTPAPDSLSNSSTPQPEVVAASAAPSAATPTKRPVVALAPLLVFTHAGVAEPNRKLTPGSLLAASTKARICTPGYTSTVRHVTTATRQQVFAAYRIGYPPRTGAYELDHLIPLELGGGNAATNLWPQPYHRGTGSADVKDHLENHLHALVCSGQVRLVVAQTAMAGDWWAAAARYNPIVVHRGAVTPAPAVRRPTPPPQHPGRRRPTGALCTPDRSAHRPARPATPRPGRRWSAGPPPTARPGPAGTGPDRSAARRCADAVYAAKRQHLAPTP